MSFVPPARRVAIAVIVPCALALGCASPPPIREAPTVGPPPPASVAPGAAPGAGPAPPERSRTPVAVARFHDPRLFRAERAELRAMLARALGRVAPELDVLPLAQVDAKLRPAARSSGARCAFANAPPERRARAAGWLTTDLLHVAGERGKGEELWVTIGDGGADGMTFAAPYDVRLPPFGRYQSAFAALQRKPDAGLVGGLAGSSKVNAGVWGPITVCETTRFGACAPESNRFGDRASELARCFAGDDEASAELVLETRTGLPRCEIADVDDIDGAAAAREACLCRALTTSVAIRDRADRRNVSVRFEASDLAGKPRPALRVVDATTNLPASHHQQVSMTTKDGKSTTVTVQSLSVDNLEASAAPLARCAAKPSTILIAELDVLEHGAVSSARVVTGAPSKEVGVCVEKALSRGAFACTEDGRAARVRLAVTWPP